VTYFFESGNTLAPRNQEREDWGGGTTTTTTITATTITTITSSSSSSSSGSGSGSGSGSSGSSSNSNRSSTITYYDYDYCVLEETQGIHSDTKFHVNVFFVLASGSPKPQFWTNFDILGICSFYR